MLLEQQISYTGLIEFLKTFDKSSSIIVLDKFSHPNQALKTVHYRINLLKDKIEHVFNFRLSYTYMALCSSNPITGILVNGLDLPLEAFKSNDGCYIGTDKQITLKGEIELFRILKIYFSVYRFILDYPEIVKEFYFICLSIANEKDPNVNSDRLDSSRQTRYYHQLKPKVDKFLSGFNHYTFSNYYDTLYSFQSFAINNQIDSGKVEESMEHIVKEMTEAEKREATNERIRQSLGTSPEYRRKIHDLFSKPRIITQTAPTPPSNQGLDAFDTESKKEELSTSDAIENTELTSSEPKGSRAIKHILRMINMKIRPM